MPFKPGGTGAHLELAAFETAVDLAAIEAGQEAPTSTTSTAIGSAFRPVLSGAILEDVSPRPVSINAAIALVRRMQGQTVLSATGEVHTVG
ncbi:hypothetical protein [Mesorhizobium carmichaelinearum]|uniref:hypothetical protein n=1 Tax=Mesorhizobium carmichaelinearum TaxID=1208188 RepID=UPI0015C8D648|nr:hypothetical protein [Mesorhizobium carmichaelinearum]